MVHELTIKSCNIFKIIFTLLFLLILSATFLQERPEIFKGAILEQFQSCFGPLILCHKETTTMNASRVSLVGKALDFGSFRDSWFESQPVHFVFLPFFNFADICKNLH